MEKVFIYWGNSNIFISAPDYNGDTSIAVLLTGDGSGFYDGGMVFCFCGKLFCNFCGI